MSVMESKGGLRLQALLLHVNGESNRSIGRRLGVDESTVRRWLGKKKP